MTVESVAFALVWVVSTLAGLALGVWLVTP